MNKISLLFAACFLILLHSCTQNKATINDDLKKHFDAAGVEGSFALLNNQSGNITVYNMTLDTTRLSPGSSFDLVNTLIGIETGVIMDDKMVVKWDGVKRQDTSWNKDLDLKEAFKISAQPYFQEIAKMIGKDTMQVWLDTLQYGNTKIGAADSFWLDNSLKITPDEQLGLMFQLYFDKLPFSKYAQSMVKGLMLQEENDQYKYNLATGSGLDEEGKSFGWAVGFIEENRHVFLISTFLRSGDKDVDMQKKGKEITHAVLEDLGFFKGQK